MVPHLPSTLQQRSPAVLCQTAAVAFFVRRSLAMIRPSSPAVKTMRELCVPSTAVTLPS